MTNYHVDCSPITNRIYAGRLDKTGQYWSSKSDVTGAACGAVAEHVIANGGSVVVSSKGVPKYEITVADLTKPEEGVEAGSYERQFREMVQLWGPVDAYARAHPKMKLGESVAKFTLERLQELDSRPQVLPATPQAFDDLAYQILALALNNGTREAFPGKLKKLLESKNADSL